MLKTAPVALVSVREKMPFEITPFMPYLTHYHEIHAAETPQSAAIGDCKDLGTRTSKAPSPRRNYRAEGRDLELSEDGRWSKCGNLAAIQSCAIPFNDHSAKRKYPGSDVKSFACGHGEQPFALHLED